MRLQQLVAQVRFQPDKTKSRGMPSASSGRPVSLCRSCKLHTPSSGLIEQVIQPRLTAPWAAQSVCFVLLSSAVDRHLLLQVAIQLLLFGRQRGRGCCRRHCDVQLECVRGAARVCAGCVLVAALRAERGGARRCGLQREEQRSGGGCEQHDTKHMLLHPSMLHCLREPLTC